MITIKPFEYKPMEHEAERASNGYLMSLVAVIVGLPLPIVNLIATFFFFVGNRNSTYFARWHTTQALLSQLILLGFNSVGFWWTIDIFIRGREEVNNLYISYMLVLLVINIIEFITTMYTATKTRNGVHVEWWLFGDITHLIVKK